MPIAIKLIFAAVIMTVVIYRTCNSTVLKNKSGIDIVFLAIFFVFLFIPSAHMNSDEIDTTENRMLSRLNSFLLQNNKINYKFGKDFDEWFNDNFFLRHNFISAYYALMPKTRVKNVIFGKDGWEFLGWNASVESYTNQKLFSEEDLAAIAEYLESIKSYCDENNKKFYLLIVPDKSKIYGEYYTDLIKQVRRESRADQLFDFLNSETGINVIYPKDLLISHKGADLLYYKTDTHWTLLGSYYGYLDLMSRIERDFPGIFVYKADKYKSYDHFGDLNGFLPKSLQIEKPIRYIIPDINSKAEHIQGKNVRDVYYTKNPVNKIKLLMFRDSFGANLIPYLAESFGEAEYVWQYNVNPRLMEDSNVIILEIVERFLPDLVKCETEN